MYIRFRKHALFYGKGDQGIAKTEDSVRNTAGIHQFSGQQEKWDCHQGKTISGVDNLLGQCIKREICKSVVHNHNNQTYQSDCIGNAKADAEKKDQKNNKDE